MKSKKGYEILAPFYTPVLNELEHYECRVGLGYSRYKSIVKGIIIEVVVFVPYKGQQEIRLIHVTNKRNEAVEIDVIPVVEYSHFEAIKQFNNADWVPQTMQSEVIEEKDDLKIIKQFAFMRKQSQINYFTSNHKIDSFETDREIFLGDYGYGTYKDPQSLHKEKLSNYVAQRGNNIVAALHKFGEVKSEQTISLITQLGQSSDLEKDKKVIESYRDKTNVLKALKEVKNHWLGYLEQLQVKTPDESFNMQLNILNPRQCMTTKNWSRFLSLYQLGLGARGIGYRDTSQDLLAASLIAPNEVKRTLEMVLSTQRRNGSAMHQFFPASMEATCGDSNELEDRDDFYGDDHLWGILSACKYVKVSGDFEFLKQIIPFYDKDKNGDSLEQGTVLEHLKRAIQFTDGHKGLNDLPLLGFADWNDTVNLPKGSESMFVANLYGKALLENIKKLNNIKSNMMS